MVEPTTMRILGPFFNTSIKFVTKLKVICLSEFTFLSRWLAKSITFIVQTDPHSSTYFKLSWEKPTHLVLCLWNPTICKFFICEFLTWKIEKQISQFYIWNFNKFAIHITLCNAGLDHYFSWNTMHDYDLRLTWSI